MLGIVAGILLLLVMGTGYQWAGTPGFCGSCHSMERVHRTWHASTHKQFACIECHLPNGNFADTIARQFFIDVWHVALFSRLVNSRDAQLAAIAAKGLKEVRYHQRFSRGWLERLGNGTELSNRKMQQAVDNLWRFTGELFLADDLELSLAGQGIAVDPRELQAEWQSTVHTALLDSGLSIPQEAAFRSGGKQGLHSEHLGPLLAEMQYLQRSHPGLQW